MSTVRFGISHLPPDDGDDAAFLGADQHAAAGAAETAGRFVPSDIIFGFC